MSERGERGRYTIGGLMVLTFWVAAVIALMRSGLEDWFFWLILGVGVVLAAHWVVFVRVPSRVFAASKPVDPRSRIKRLERIAAVPSLLGPAIKQVVWMALIHCNLVDGNAAEAERWCRLALSRRLPRSARAVFHQRLADCLDSQPGRAEEANAERDQAKALLKGARKNLQGWLAQAAIHENERDYIAAHEAYQEALKRTKGQTAALRDQIQALLAISSLNAGRPDFTLRWTELVLAGSRRGNTLARRIALRLASYALGQLGRFEEAEAPAREALEMTEAAGQEDEAADARAQLASIILAQGNLGAAEEQIQHALATMSRPSHGVLVVQADWLALLGRFEEARQCLVKARDGAIAHGTTQALRTRVRSLSDLQLARVLEEMGHVEGAWTVHQRALADAGSDHRLRTWCDATRMRLLAKLDRREEAEAIARRLGPEANPRNPDRYTCLAVTHALASWSQAVGDLDHALEMWNAYLDAPCRPVERPTAEYHLGRAHLARGDQAEAIAAFERAVDCNIATHDATRARERLAELNPSAT